MKRVLFFINCLVLVSSVGEAQYSRYVVAFKNKNGSNFTIANPSAYLSAKSIARRSRQNIIIDSTDLPITPAYLDSIRSVPNVVILNKSNWLNQVCIGTTDAAAISKINSFSFIRTAAAPVALRLMVASDTNSKVIEEDIVPLMRVNREASTNANSLNYGNSLNQVHIHNGEYLHNQGFTGEGIIIAILDAGFFGYKTNVMFDSVRLQNRILGEWDFVANEQSVNEDNFHGMACLSIIAANRPGLMVGSSPKARFYLYRTEDVGSEYPIEEQNWLAAAERADSAGVDMISSSLGYSDFDDHAFDHSYAQRDGNTTVITKAADLAAKKGIIVMNSAGNDGASNTDERFVACPADGDSVTAVGAVDVNGAIAAFSSWGPNGAGKRKPNIVSLGVATTIAGTDGNPSAGNGTSYANPNMAGLIACFWQAFPEFNNMTIIDAVQQSSSRFSNPDNRFGYGVPNFKKAFAILVGKSFKGNMATDRCFTSFSWSGKDDNQMRYEIERKAGSDTGYTKLTSINSSSAAFSLNSYTFRDTLKFLSATSVRYRLKEILPGDSAVVLLDSTFTTTTSCAVGNVIAVGPNPVKNTINLSLNSNTPVQKMSISLYNILGQRLYYYEGSMVAGSTSHIIPASKLPGGIYIITVKDDRKILFSSKIVK